MLRHDAHERKEYKDKLEVALKELKFVRSSVVVSDETKCDTCAVHMSNLASMQTKYASLLDESDGLKARPVLLGACKSCSSLQSKLVEKVARISLLEKASSDSIAARCARCESLELELESSSHDKMRTKEDNTNLRFILS